MRALTIVACLAALGACTTSPAPVLPASGPERSILADFPRVQSAALPTGAITTILLASCMNEEWGRDQAVLERMAARGGDLALLLGDNVYGSATGEDPVLSDLRAAYWQQARRREFTGFVAKVPTLAIWDDHDFGKNDAGGEDFPQRDLAQAMFDAFWGVGADDPQGHDDGVYGAWTFGEPGRRVQVILLDTRYSRSPLKPTDQRDAPGRERYVADETPGRTMLGERQWAWLEARLREPADLRIVASSVQVAAEGHGFEKWGNFPAEKRRLYDLIGETGATGVVFVSGDRHASSLNRETPASVAYPMYDLTASSVNMPWGVAGSEAQGNRLTEMYGRENYGLVEIDWEGRSVRLSIRDKADAEVFARVIPFAEIGAR